MRRGGEWLGRIRAAGTREVSGASAAVLRVAFGIAMVVNVCLYLPQLVHYYYVKPSFTFGYPPFDFIQPLPGPGMQLVYVAMAVLGLTIAAGLWYRVSCAVFCALNTYVFLLDSSYFQNHEYLISLLSFLMIFLPLHRRWSLDARRRPEIASPTIPAWVVWLLRFQIGVPYFFGGIAKINSDWLRGEPLRLWLADRTDVPLIGRFYTDEPMVLFMTYGSLVFDLLVVWFLLHHRTRPFAYAVALCFHLLNARMFGLYVFPWLMIAATLIFFRPDWPERLWARARRLLEDRGSGTGPAAEPERQREPEPVPEPVQVPEPAPERGPEPEPERSAPEPERSAPEPAGVGARDGGAMRPMAPLLVGALVAWAAVQVLLPFRHLLIPGDTNWTEQGHRFAWHMMLRTKDSHAVFTLNDGERTWKIRNSDYLTGKQEARMAGHPERIVLFARHLSELHDGAEVRVDAWAGLNGREKAQLVDPTVDLSVITPIWWGNAEWILPLEEPLKR